MIEPIMFVGIGFWSPACSSSASSRWCMRARCASPRGGWKP